MKNESFLDVDIIMGNNAIIDFEQKKLNVNGEETYIGVPYGNDTYFINPISTFPKEGMYKINFKETPYPEILYADIDNPDFKFDLYNNTVSFQKEIYCAPGDKPKFSTNLDGYYLYIDKKEYSKYNFYKNYINFYCKLYSETDKNKKNIILQIDFPPSPHDELIQGVISSFVFDCPIKYDFGLSYYKTENKFLNKEKIKDKTSLKNIVKVDVSLCKDNLRVYQVKDGKDLNKVKFHLRTFDDKVFCGTIFNTKNWKLLSNKDIETSKKYYKSFFCEECIKLSGYLD